MVDRRTMIIIKAIKLFAAKGYHSTSIQEIAEACGIAKGTLYNYFASKEDIMLSILKYYWEMINREVEHIAKDENLTPKEIFLKQIQFQLEECVKHRDFIEMHIREYAIHVNDEINDFLFEIRAKKIRWIVGCLINVYGEEIHPFVLDLAAIFQGVVREYLEYIVLDKREFNIAKLSKFIMKQMDELVNGYLNSGEYFLEYSDFAEVLRINNPNREKLNCKVKGIIRQVLKKVVETNLSEDLIKKIKTTMEVLEDEFITKEEPKLIVIEGLLVYLKFLGLTELEQYWKHLDEIFHEYSGTFSNPNP